MIIYGDLQTVEDEDGEATTTRKLKFRSDGTVLCGTRFRNFPEELDNDVSLFIQTFKDAVLGLYDGNEEEMKKAQAEQKKNMEEKSSKFIKSENIEQGIVELKEEIKSIVSSLGKSDKREIANKFEEILGMADYKKSEDIEALEEALEYLKSNF